MRTSAGAVYSLTLLTALEAEMKAQGMTHQELAERAGVSYSFLSAILVGKGNPSLQVLAAFATALDVPLSRLFESSELGEAGKEVLPGSGRNELIPPGFRRVNCILPESRASIVDEWAEIARKAIERLDPRPVKRTKR